MLGEETGITIGLVVLVAGVAGAWLWRLEGRFAAAAEHRREIEKALADHKLYVAETYMSKASGGMAIDRAVTEIKGLRSDLKEEVALLRSDWKGQLDKFGDRIERMEGHVMRGSNDR